MSDTRKGYCCLGKRMPTVVCGANCSSAVNGGARREGDEHCESERCGDSLGAPRPGPGSATSIRPRVGIAPSRGARGRLLLRLLIVADLDRPRHGALALRSRHRGERHRVPAHAPGVARGRADLRPLHGRQATHESLDDRRGGEGLPLGDRWNVDRLPRLLAPVADGGCGAADRVLGVRDRAHRVQPWCREGSLAPSGRLHPERRHRGGGGHRPADRAQAAPASRVRDQSRRIRRRGAQGAAEGVARNHAARRSCRAAPDRRAAWRRSRDHRVLERSSRRAPRCDPIAADARRPGGHRPAAVRGDRLRVRDSRRRGSAAPRPSLQRCLTRRPCRQALPRRGGRDACDRADRAALSADRTSDQARLARPGLLQAEAARNGDARVLDAQVPHDENRDRRGNPPRNTSGRS